MLVVYIEKEKNVYTALSPLIIHVHDKMTMSKVT